MTREFLEYRDRLVSILKDGPLSFGEVVAAMGITPGFATALIISLRKSDLVLRRHMGQRRVYVWIGPEEQEAAE